MKIIDMMRKAKQFIKRELSPFGFCRSYIVFPIMGFLRVHRIAGLHKPYDKIENVKNVHEGERCFILATGPSLTFEDVMLLKNEHTIGINTIFQLFEQTDWRPDYYVMLDPNLYRSLHSKGKVDLDSFSKYYSFANNVCRDIVAGEKAVLVNYCWLDHIYHYGDSKCFKYNPNLLFGLYDFYSVTQASIVLAMYMGFKEIYLLGADNNYLGKKQHFSKVDGQFTIQEEQAYKAQRTNNWGYEALKEIADKQGVKIYNATRGGCVECYPRVKLEDVL